MRPKALFALVCAFVLTAPAVTHAAHGSRLQTSKGTMQLGGHVTLTYQNVKMTGQPSVSGGIFDLSPEFGYFVINNLRLKGSVNLGVGFGDLPYSDATSIGFAFEIAYLFNFGSIVVPYVGVGAGPQFVIPRPADRSTIGSMGLAIPAGILIALNHQVAIDIGTRLSFDFRVTDPGQTTITIPIGYLGVQAFF